MKIAEYQGLLKRLVSKNQLVSFKKKGRREKNLQTGMEPGLCQPGCRIERAAARPRSRPVPALVPACSDTYPASRPARAGSLGHLTGITPGLCRLPCRLARPHSRLPARLRPVPMPVRPRL